MSEHTTIARPYAKAAFYHALAINKLDLWSAMLEGFALIEQDALAKVFLDNPAASIEQKVLLFALVGEQLVQDKESDNAQNFIKVLAENRRIGVLPEINRLFVLLRADYEKTLNVTVRSFKPLSEAQKSKLMQSLEARLQRKIVIDEVVDNNLLGGAVIQAGDFVIDGSVKGKLNKLAANIAA